MLLDATRNAVRKQVVDALGPAPVSMDELARATGLGIRSVRIALLESPLLASGTDLGLLAAQETADVGPVRPEQEECQDGEQQP